jgi:hypothetical protein
VKVGNLDMIKRVHGVVAVIVVRFSAPDGAEFRSRS